jgi:hypothetical protein
MALTKIPASLLDTSSGFDLQGNITLGDNERIQFGNGTDFEIYSDGGSNNYLISNNGALILRNLGDDKDIYLQSDDGSGGFTSYIHAKGSTGEVILKHYGSNKITTTSTGATVTGNLAVTGDLDITGNVNSYNVTDLDVTDKTITLGAGQTEANSGGSGIIIDGSSASILWDETNDVFGINKGLTASGNVEIGSIETTTNFPLIVKSGTNDHAIAIEEASGGETWQLGVNVNGDLGFYNSGSATASVTFDDSGNVGIGGTSTARLLVQNDGASTLNIVSNDGGIASINFGDASDASRGQIQYENNTEALTFSVNNLAEAMRIDSSGNVEVRDGGSLRAYRSGNSAYAGLFMDAGEKLYIRNSWGVKDIVMLRTGEVGIGTATPASYLHVKGSASDTSGIITRFERTDASNAWVQIKGNATNSFELGSTTGGIEFYDDASSTYVAKINNSTNDHNLQKWCYAEFDVYDNGSADAWEEKANLAANVYSLYGANINPGKYSNNQYYVGVGRENTDEAYVEFKVDLVEARSIYAYFGVSNSADASTRYARLWYSYDGEIYTQVDNNSFGAGGGSADYTLNLTSVLHHGDGDFTGSVYFRCGLMDNAATHTTLIGWIDFKFKAFAESMTFDGRYKRGSSSTSLVDNSGGGQETNFVPKVPYVHTFTMTSAGTTDIVSNNGGNGRFTSTGHSHLNKEIFQIVSSPTYGIQCLTEGTIFYTLHQDIITSGSTSYARVYVQRLNSNVSASANVGMHLVTNTNGEWNSITGQGSFDVVAGDIIRFNYSATGIVGMDAGSWSYYTLMMIPPTTSFKGFTQGNSSLPFAGGI